MSRCWLAGSSLFCSVCAISQRQIMQCDTRCFPHFLLIPHRTARRLCFTTAAEANMFFLHFHSLLHAVARNQNESAVNTPAFQSLVEFFSLFSQCKYHQKMFCDAFSIETEMFCLFALVYTWFWYGTTFFYQIEKHSALIKFVLSKGL